MTKYVQHKWQGKTTTRNNLFITVHDHRNVQISRKSIFFDRHDTTTKLKQLGEKYSDLQYLDTGGKHVAFCSAIISCLGVMFLVHCVPR